MVSPVGPQGGPRGGGGFYAYGTPSAPRGPPQGPPGDFRNGGYGGGWGAPGPQEGEYYYYLFV